MDAYGPAPDPMASFDGGLGTETPGPGADAGSASPDASQSDPGTGSPGDPGSSSDPSNSNSGTDSNPEEPPEAEPAPEPEPPASGETPSGEGDSGESDPGGGGAPGGGLPILLDLNGDGVEIVSADQSHVTMDWDEDGYKEKTAWASSDDGVLVLDLNADGSAGGDGKITRLDEIAFSRWYSGAQTDMHGLRMAFDTNSDFVLNAQDARFGQFKVWRDTNNNGKTDSGEMQTLAALGITAISLLTNNVRRNLSDGSTIFGTGSFTRNNRLTIWSTPLCATSCSARRRNPAPAVRIPCSAAPRSTRSKAVAELIRSQAEPATTRSSAAIRTITSTAKAETT